MLKYSLKLVFKYLFTQTARVFILYVHCCLYLMRLFTAGSPHQQMK